MFVGPSEAQLQLIPFPPLGFLLCPVSVAGVDCTKSSSLCSKYEVKAYPTIKYFTKGAAEPEPYAVRVAKRPFASQQPPRDVRIFFLIHSRNSLSTLQGGRSADSFTSFLKRKTAAREEL